MMQPLLYIVILHRPYHYGYVFASRYKQKWKR